MNRSPVPAGRILILGGSRLQMPLIQAANEMGLSVGVVDRDSSAIGRSACVHFFEVSTTDTEGISDVAERFMPSAVVTMATDMPMRAVASVASRQHLPGPELGAIEVATDKGLMREAFKKHGLPSPQFAVINEPFDDECSALLGNMAYPLVVKPADSSGSRGVNLVHDFGELNRSIVRALEISRSGRAVVEEFVAGPEVSVEVLCFGGRAHVIAVTDKTTTGPPHFVETLHRQPSALPSRTLGEVEGLAVEVCESLGLNDCAAHIEMKITGNGPILVEIGARLGGDFITSHLTPLATGVDMVRALVDISFGRIPEIAAVRPGAGAVVFLSASAAAAIDPGLRSAIAADPAVVELETYGAGSDSMESSEDRAGHVVLSGRTNSEIDDALLRLSALIPCFDLPLRSKGDPIDDWSDHEN